MQGLPGERSCLLAIRSTSSYATVNSLTCVRQRGSIASFKRRCNLERSSYRKTEPPPLTAGALLLMGETGLEPVASSL